MQPNFLSLISRHRLLVAVTVLQFVCALYFLEDAVTEWESMLSDPAQGLFELLAVAALWLGSALGISEIRRLMRENLHMEDRMRAASGAFLDLVEDSFRKWGLTESERDVALLSIKGLSIAEIAALRSTRDGTVKAQCAAVYRKAGVSGRAQLISHFVEDLMSGVVLEPGPQG